MLGERRQRISTSFAIQPLTETFGFERLTGALLYPLTHPRPHPRDDRQQLPVRLCHHPQALVEQDGARDEVMHWSMERILVMATLFCAVPGGALEAFAGNRDRTARTGGACTPPAFLSSART